jgi:hypothetical protein
MRPVLLARLARAAIAAALVAPPLAGCTTVHESPWLRVVPNLRLYSLEVPADARVVGEVKVEGVDEEANVDSLLPQFQRRVRELGGTGGIVDRIWTTYELRTVLRPESIPVACGYYATCFVTRVVPVTTEARVLRIQGRALAPDTTHDTAGER